MNKNTPASHLPKQKKFSALQKDAICLALVVMAVFALHLFSKSTVEQLYKSKNKDNAATTLPVSHKSSVF